VSSTNPFDDHQAEWDEYRASPWGRLRYELVARTLAQCLGREQLRILDVGGGDGGDALPLLRAGHDVTVLDSSREMLARAAEAGVPTRAGSLDDENLEAGLDVVLCHFLLQYRSDLSADVRRLARLLRAGGTLSLIVPTAPGQVLAAAVRGGPQKARELLGATTMRVVAFDQEVRRFTIEDVTTALRSAGFDEPMVFGIRMVNDLITDDERKKDPEFFEELLELEWALCGVEPYCRIGMATHFVAQVGLSA
jgi:S-adenosylmethionine-dependent methyltransferase